MKPQNIIAPSIHLNGTSREELVRQMQDAVDALNLALGALHDAQPNSRDYYPQGPDAIQKAEFHHRRRLEDLVEIRDEMMAIWEKMLSRP